MKLTHKLLELGISDNGAWNRKQLILFKVEWPLVKGWKQRLIGLEVTKECFEKFLTLKNIHLKDMKQKKFDFETDLDEMNYQQMSHLNAIHDEMCPGDGRSIIYSRGL